MYLTGEYTQKLPIFEDTKTVVDEISQDLPTFQKYRCLPKNYF